MPGVSNPVAPRRPADLRNSSVAMHGIIRQMLLAGVACSLLLPIVLAVVIGLGVLLRAVGDVAGGVVCGRIALVVGAAWLVAVVTTAVASGAALLDERPHPAETDGTRHP